MAALAVAMFAACGGDNKNNDGPTVTVSTETTAEFDNSNFGLYKGVIAGSSGTVKIEIHNGDDDAKAVIEMGGESDELTTTATFTEGQAVTGAEFTGEHSSFTFGVGANGSNPQITNIVIEGHENVIASVSKEKSENVSVCYEGTSVGGMEHRGVFNIVRNNTSFSGVIKGEDGFVSGLTGTVNGNSFSGSSNGTQGDLNIKLNYSGTFNGNSVSGKWSNSWVDNQGNNRTNSGTFSGSKTL
jgi:hypothetical protein